MKMSNNEEKKIDSLIDDLNPQQKIAVLHNSNSLRIIAGAGTGKTKVLTRKISYLITRMDVAPESILAITFTNKAAIAMRRRLQRHLGKLVKKVYVETFYTLCTKILRKDSHLIKIKNDFTILDDIETLEIMKRIYKRLNIDETLISYKFAIRAISHDKLNDFFDSQLLSGIRLTPEEEVAIQKIIAAYNAYLKNHNILDLEDLLILTHRLLVFYPQIAEEWQDKFKYVLVDEFQDINIIQYGILEIISKKSNVTVVGDSDQTIYSWRGADVKLFLNFDQDYPNLTTIMLTENYRSNEKILEAANSLISKNKLRFDKNLFTSKAGGHEIEFNHAFSSEAEARWIVSKINELKKQKIQLKNIAILYRSNYLIRALEQQLVLENINHIVYGGVKFYEQPIVKQVMWFLRVLYDTSNIAFENVINLPVQRVTPDSLKKIIDASDLEKTNGIYKYLLQNYSKLKISAKERKSLLAFLKEIAKFKKIFANEGSKAKISYILENFLINIDFYNHLEKHTQDEDDAIQIINELYSAADKWQNENPDATLKDWFEYVTLFSENEEVNKGNNYVSLMTVHNSKGLEFENVFLMSMSDTTFPFYSRTQDENGNEDEDKIEEERRLAYVAITRAKERLYISNARGVDLTTHKQKIPSRFIKEMNIDLEKHIMNLDSLGQELDHNLKEKIWVIGDHVTHRSFGEGEIVDIKNKDDIVVVFQKEGLKVIKKNHEAIRLIPRQK
ncbi:hypothetical protein CJJ23_03510 [Mycoplasmopsis agassizii]|uniref:DNA 3'-5' helicase n=2 Tax=Mycoplasmopsis agassizii TaxID=33922 RepID=A0A269TIF1_9BACT|nr:hypothetical protein CJJ23_03510 [Mycoplasmopsis agassizii]